MPRSGARCARGDSQAAPAGGRAAGSPPPPSFLEPVARLPGDTIAVVTKRDGSHMAAGTHGAVIRLRRTLKRPKMGSFARSNGRYKYRRAAVESRLAAARAGVVVSVMPDREAAVPGHAKKYRPLSGGSGRGPPVRHLPLLSFPPPRPRISACRDPAASPGRARRPLPHCMRISSGGACLPAEAALCDARLHRLQCARRGVDRTRLPDAAASSRSPAKESGLRLVAGRFRLEEKGKFTAAACA